MSLYGYNNLQNQPTRLVSSPVQFGILAGQVLSDIYTMHAYHRNDAGRPIPPKEEEDAELLLLDVVTAGDVVVTDTLTNFSLDFISSLQSVEMFAKKGVRVVSIIEGFDSDSPEGKALLEAMPIMITHRQLAFESKRQARREGIAKAVEEGKYKGRQALSPADFPNFRDLYNMYMFREIGKGEFAASLGVSRPTLDRLLDEYLKKGEKNNGTN